MEYRLSADAACADLDDGAVVLDLRSKRYYSLNETGAAIWRLLAGGVARAEMPARLVERYAVTEKAAEAACARLLAALVAEELIHCAD